MSCRAVWTESRDRPAKSEQSADRSPSSRGVQWTSSGSVICSSPPRVYILHGVRRRCVWAVGRLCVTACVAAAVDRQARRSCRESGAFCVGVRPAVASAVPAPPDTLRYNVLYATQNLHMLRTAGTDTWTLNALVGWSGRLNSQLSSQLCMLRYDTRCYFNVRSKADISQLNLPHGA